MELDALYAEVILDHNRSPRNWGELPEPARRVDGHNPLCGDRLTLFVDVDGERIRDVRFTGEGCAISKASASMMTQVVKGKTLDEANALSERFRSMATGQQSADTSLGSLRAFAGVSRFPMRVKCATLAWHALRSVIHGEQTATTEGAEEK
jgi:nitrogen fixation protein NifU and related proteins